MESLSAIEVKLELEFMSRGDRKTMTQSVPSQSDLWAVEDWYFM